MNGLLGPESRLIELFDTDAAFWIALVVALGVGALHAVAPGHGKSVTAAYLVGTRGCYRDALRLGVIVALMHTLSVLVLATVWVGVSGAGGYATETVTAWMQVGVGIVVIAVGVHLTWRHVRARGAVGHGHGHLHDADPWSRRGLVALALAGGLLPSPSAFLVLVSGLLTGRSGGAVVLVLAFGTGMAVTLTGVGVATIRGYGLLAGHPRMAALTAWMPMLAGLAVSAGGVVYLVAAAGALA